jgi:hypothetical protein
MTTPTARTLRRLRRAGWTAAVVERWNPFGGVRQDLFGFADVLAVREGEPPLLIQTTSASNLAARVAKALARPELRTWLATGSRFEAWGWGKRGAKGARKLWRCCVRELSLADL